MGIQIDHLSDRQPTGGQSQLAAPRPVPTDKKSAMRNMKKPPLPRAACGVEDGVSMWKNWPSMRQPAAR